MLKNEIRQLKIDNANLKKDIKAASTLNSPEYNHLVSFLKTSFDNLLNELKLTPKEIEISKGIMKILGYDEKEIKEIDKKKKKGIFG